MTSLNMDDCEEWLAKSQEVHSWRSAIIREEDLGLSWPSRLTPPDSITERCVFQCGVINHHHPFNQSKTPIGIPRYFQVEDSFSEPLFFAKPLECYPWLSRLSVMDMWMILLWIMEGVSQIYMIQIYSGYSHFQQLTPEIIVVELEGRHLNNKLNLCDWQIWSQNKRRFECILPTSCGSVANILG